MIRRNDDERGATFILVAACLTLLIGMAAIAVDLGAGWNARRQDQTAADLAAVAGAIAYVSSNVQTETVNQVLSISAMNLGLTTDPTWGYTTTDTSWRNAWTGCTDPARPTGFNTFNAPSAWGGGAMQCISGSATEIRVRLPNQFTATSFGKVLGQSQITTFAVAHATLKFRSGGGVRPFGILNGIAAGTTCLTTSPSGLAAPPCDGPASGNFGTLNSQTWGSPDFGTTLDCGSPGNEELGLAIAKGLDHLIGLHPNYAGTGQPYGTAAYPSSTARDDDCTNSGGVAVPSDNTPPVGPVNSMRADTGFNLFQATKNGIITGEDGFPNSTTSVTPLLQDIGASGSLSDRRLSERISGTEYNYQVDNTPLHDHLRSWGNISSDINAAYPAAGGAIIAALGGCQKATISGAADPSTAMSLCLKAYETTAVTYPSLPPLFEDTLGNNPRFGFVPQFHATTWGSGNHWQPILRYRMMYIDTIWFNCNGKYDPNKNDEACTGTKGLVFTPEGSADTSDLQVGSGGSMRQLRLDQISAFLLPNQVVSEDTASRFPGNVFGPFNVQLSR